MTKQKYETGKAYYLKIKVKNQQPVVKGHDGTVLRVGNWFGSAFVLANGTAVSADQCVSIKKVKNQ